MSFERHNGWMVEPSEHRLHIGKIAIRVFAPDLEIRERRIRQKALIFVNSRHDPRPLEVCKGCLEFSGTHQFVRDAKPRLAVAIGREIDSECAAVFERTMK